MSIRKTIFTDNYPKIKGNFTLFPNEFYDEIDRYLSASQSKVFTHLWRLIHEASQSKEPDLMGISPKTRQVGVGVLVERTGCSRQTIISAIQELIDLGLVVLVKKGGGLESNVYAIPQIDKSSIDYIKFIKSKIENDSQVNMYCTPFGVG